MSAGKGTTGKVPEKTSTIPSGVRSKSGSVSESGGGQGALLALQRAAGNQAVTHLLGRSSGRPLDAVTRRKMESKFGESFRDVQVHTDSEASKSAEVLGANAWTGGRDIVFGEGRYAPETRTGRARLAHELAHVAQQRRGGAAPETFETQSASEHDAGTAAAQINSSCAVAVTASTGVGVAREEAELPWWKKKLNPIYQRALEVLPKEAAQKLEEANAVAKQYVEKTGTSDETLNKVVQSAEPVIAPTQAVLGVNDQAGPAPKAETSTDVPAAKTAESQTRLGSGLGGTLLAAAPFLVPGGGGLSGPPIVVDPTTVPMSPNQTFANLGRGLGPDTATAGTSAADTAAADTVVADTVAADTVASTTAESVAPSLVARLLPYAARGGVATAAFAAGFFGPFLIGRALEHAEELRQQPDPDERDQATAGAPPPVVTDGDAGAKTEDELDAGAGEIQQAPAHQPQAPAVDPGSVDRAVLPPNQDQAPAGDPGRNDNAQLPGQSTEELDASRTASSRPGLRDSTILQVWQNALRAGKGVVRDPNTGEKLEPPYYDENGKLIYDWHMGHTEDHEWWRLRKMYEAGLLTWPEVIGIYNEPGHYHPEDPEANESHEHESKQEWVLPDGTVIKWGPEKPPVRKRKR